MLINGEPTDLKLATGQRGVQQVCLRCEGRAAHSGSPELGRNATWPLLDWLQRLREQPRPVDGKLGPELWNLGLLRAGEASEFDPRESRGPPDGPHRAGQHLPGRCSTAGTG